MNKADASKPNDGKPGRLQRWAPGLAMLLQYQPAWLVKDVMAGLVLSALLVPVGIGYAQASGLPGIHGLYATITPLIIYAIFGPSRIMVLGPDSTLAALIAALILPMAAGNVDRAIALAGMLALLSGACSLLIGLARLGLIADLLSKPIRIGFLNAIALTISIGQLPKLFGLTISGDDWLDRTRQLLQGIADGRSNPAALALGATSLALILLLQRYRPHWPGILLAVGLSSGVSAAFDLSGTAGLAVLGNLPQGLPGLRIPQLALHDILQLLPGALIIALLSFADTAVLSRSLAQRGGYQVNQNQEMIALGAANLASGLFQGFSVSSSASRTPVVAAAGARSQLAALIGAIGVASLLLFAPGLLSSLPSAALGAVVIAACWSFVDLRGMWTLYRLRRIEFALALTSFLGVAMVGVIEGIVIAITLALLVLVWNTWHPHFAVLARVDGAKGYHDLLRHPEGRQVPGMLLFRWDAPLFFANAEIFRQQLLRALARPAQPATATTIWVVVAADAISDVDITAADTLTALHHDLQQQGIMLRFAGLKGPVKDRLNHYGTLDLIGHDIFFPTVGQAVHRYRDDYKLDWKDWDEGENGVL